MLVKIKLSPVKLNKQSTCLTYAIQRIGLDPSGASYEEIGRWFDVHPFFFGPLCNTGVILVWDANAKISDLPFEIDDHGRIISRPVIHGVHFGVYEGNGLVSDCSRLDSPGSLPILRMRHLNEFKRQPDKILIYKNIVKNEGGEKQKA